MVVKCLSDKETSGKFNVQAVENTTISNLW